jgi:hypothetical protein
MPPKRFEIPSLLPAAPQARHHGLALSQPTLAIHGQSDVPLSGTCATT